MHRSGDWAFYCADNPLSRVEEQSFLAGARRFSGRGPIIVLLADDSPHTAPSNYTCTSVSVAAKLRLSGYRYSHTLGYVSKRVSLMGECADIPITCP